eukprot:CAMPEP_0177608422 /NCGR_PEP_ID=MMETSP0419_2-20121207/18464_1 /TAXON_ID=582737 /ORGANISM="Tetraselmis sp., Strain GSL018" /LENGTH=156 /DNA_ID=CAMNT_0019103113 /DNA_START=132 /DNA_END=600 /DNA_ORIENTATION=-
MFVSAFSVFKSQDTPWICRLENVTPPGFVSAETVLQARGDGERSTAYSTLSSAVESPLYSRWLQGFVFVALLGLTDAAYSGDWSRIGAISAEREEELKKVCVCIAAFHACCAPLAAAAAARKGLNWPLLAAKAAAVGGLALIEALLLDPRRGDGGE